MTDTVRYANRSSTPGGNGTTNATSGPNRAYSSLAEWNTNEATTIVSGDRHICYLTAPPGNPDPSYLDLFPNWVVQSGGQLIITREPSAPDRPLLKPAADIANNVFTLDNFTIISEIDIDCSDMNQPTQNVLYFVGDGHRCRELKAWNNQAGNFGYGDGQYAKNNTHLINCMAFNMSGCALTNSSSRNHDLSVFNCTFWNFDGICLHQRRSGSDYVAKNTAAHSNGGIEAFQSSVGTWAGDNNISSHPSDGMPGLNSHSGVTFQEGGGGSGDRIMFVSLTNTVDLHLHDDAANIALDNGVGPGADGDIPTVDWDLDARAGANCDIGADEFTGGVVPIEGNISLGLNTGLSSGANIITGDSVSLPVAVGLDSKGVLDLVGSIGLPVVAGLDSKGVLDLVGSIGLPVVAGLGSAGGLRLVGSISLPVSTDLTASGESGIAGSISLDTVVGLNAQGKADYTGGISLDVTTGLSTSGLADLFGAIALDYISDLEARGGIVTEGSITLGVTISQTGDGIVISDISEDTARDRTFYVGRQSRRLQVPRQDRTAKIKG